MTDLDELERLARGTDGGLGDDDPWPTAGDIAGGFSWNRLEARYIAAASPDVILDLIARVRAAEGTVALLSDEIRRKGLTSGSAMAAHLDVELDLIDRVRAAEGDAQRWRGRVTRLKAFVAQTAAAMSRRGHYEIAQRLVAGYDEIIATEAASEDFVTAQPATTKP